MMDFENYCEPQDIEFAYQNGWRETTIQELNMGHIKNISEVMLRTYWNRKMNAEWHKYGMFVFCLLANKKMFDDSKNPDDLKYRCMLHLNVCYELDAQCEECKKSVVGSESDRFCARCYRAKIQDWRPL